MLEIELGTPNQLLPSKIPLPNPSPTFRHVFLEIYICLRAIVIGVSMGLAAHCEGGVRWVQGRAINLATRGI